MTTDFRFVAYRDFKRTLGKINAVVECAELATRKFVDEAEHDTDPDKFVQQVSAEFKVRVDKLDMALDCELLVGSELFENVTHANVSHRYRSGYGSRVSEAYC